MSIQFNKIQFPFHAPDDGAPKGTEPTNVTSKEDMIDFLNEDKIDDDIIELEPETPKKKEPEVKKEKEKGDEKEEEDDEEEDEEEDELKDIEEELEGPTEEQLELVSPVRRRDILKKYPTIFKDFPYLEKAYYREQQFTELYPTIDDARQATEKSNALDRFEADLVNGNTETILTSLKKESPQGFNKLVDNYLVTLSKVDQNAYHHVMGNTIKHTIGAMLNAARESSDENLHNAALVLNKFVFNSTKPTPPTNLSDTDTEPKKNDDVEKQRQAFIKERFETVRDDLSTRVTNSLKATVEANIDPKSSMTDYVKRNASREAIENLTGLVQKDSRFKNLLDKLWESALEKNFDKTSVDRIRAAYLSKAKTLLPSVIKKARNDALKGMGKRVRETDDTTETDTESRSTKSQKTEKPSSQRDGNKKLGRITNPKDIPAGTRSIDFLMADD